MLLLPGAAWGAGRALRERELVANQLAERARELEQEREAHAALSVRYERARIASELHDIVAHAISVMVVQASAGQRLAARDPEATAETLEAIAGAARQAEQDMGRLVALLGDESAIGPAPDLALVEELVARASGSGLDVTLRLEGEREGLPAPVVEAAYRVVQEGLTNALRYAAGAAVKVLVRGDDDALTVQVDNGPASGEVALAGAGMGTGLQGLRERAAACGGTLDAGTTAEGGWRLAARLPRRVAAAHPSG
jgi:signal transduction histidine kinase